MIPRTTADQKRDIAARALALEGLHTALREVNAEIDHRLSVRSGTAPDHRSEDWVLPMLGTPASWKRKAPASLTAPKQTQWAQEQRGRLRENELARIQTAMVPGRLFTVQLHGGELRLLAGDTLLIERIFVSDGEGPFIAALWQRALLRLSTNANMDAARLVDSLRKLHKSENAALRQQVIERQQQANALSLEIDASERHMNEEVFRLYRLSDAERRMIEGT